jgi:hypothetical protein
VFCHVNPDKARTIITAASIVTRLEVQIMVVFMLSNSDEYLIGGGVYQRNIPIYTACIHSFLKNRGLPVIVTVYRV